MNWTFIEPNMNLAKHNSLAPTERTRIVMDVRQFWRLCHSDQTVSNQVSSRNTQPVKRLDSGSDLSTHCKRAPHINRTIVRCRPALVIFPIHPRFHTWSLRNLLLTPIISGFVYLLEMRFTKLNYHTSQAKVIHFINKDVGTLIGIVQWWSCN